MDDVWSAPSGRPGPAPPDVPPNPRLAFRLRRERIVEAWPAHARQRLSFLQRPDVAALLVPVIWATVMLVSAVIQTRGPERLLYAGLSAAGLLFGLVWAGRAWPRRAERIWAQAEGVAWKDGDRAEVEFGGDAFRYRTSRQELTLRLEDVVGSTQVGDTLFLWTRQRTFVPVDGGTLEEGDFAGFIVAATAAIRAGLGAPQPKESHRIPEGAIRVRFAGARLGERILRNLAVTAVFVPVLPVAMGVGLAIAAAGAAFGLASIAIVGLMLAGVVGSVFLAVPIGVLRARRLQPHVEWVELAVDGEWLYARSPVDGWSIRLDRVRRLYRWPGGEVWIRVGQQAWFVRRTAIAGDREAFLAALEAGLAKVRERR